VSNSDDDNGDNHDENDEDDSTEAEEDVLVDSSEAFQPHLRAHAGNDSVEDRWTRLNTQQRK